MKSKKFVPDPAIYELSGSLINKKPSGLSKGKRVMMADEIANNEKKNLKPGPGEYKPSLKPKYLGAFNLKDKKTTSFIDEAEYMSLQTPTPYQASYTLVEPKSLAPKLIKPKEQIGERFILKKSNEPSPG